jgi:hypothetical protein
MRRVIDEDGATGDPIHGSAGSVIECSDAVVIELLVL